MCPPLVYPTFPDLGFWDEGLRLAFADCGCGAGEGATTGEWMQLGDTRNGEALREPLRAALAPILYEEDVDEMLRTKLDDLVRRAEACGH